MNVLVLNQYASSPVYSTGAGERHYYIAKKLISKNVNTTIVSASFNHLFHTNPTIPRGKLITKEHLNGVDFIWVKIRRYSSLSGFGRAFSWIEFLSKLFFLKDIPRPDIVIVSSMSMMPAIYAAYLKRKYKIPFVFEVRDIWPLTYIELGNTTKYHPVVFFLGLIESFSYKQAVSLVSVLPGFKQYITKYFKSYAKEVTWIPNGISPDLLDEKTQLTQSNSRYGNNFKIVYAGAIGVANHTRFLVEAAILLKNQVDIEFHILGDGYEKPILEELSNRNGLTNVFFHQKIPKGEVNSFINLADVCYHGCKKSYLYSYGISPNKLNDYMLAAKPILSASGLDNDPAKIANCGIVVESGNARAIADGILYLKSLSNTELLRLGRNGFEYLMTNQTYDVLAEKYYDLLKKHVAK